MHRGYSPSLSKNFLDFRPEMLKRLCKSNYPRGNNRSKDQCVCEVHSIPRNSYASARTKCRSYPHSHYYYDCLFRTALARWHKMKQDESRGGGVLGSCFLVILDLIAASCRKGGHILRPCVEICGKRSVSGSRL